MMNIFLSALLGFSASVVPLVAAGAAAYPGYQATLWQSSFHKLPIPGGQPAELVITRNSSGVPDGSGGSDRDHLLPFEFRFDGVSYDAINIGTKGYITFGEHLGESSVTIDSPVGFIGTGNPVRLIAAWWGDHICDLDAGAIQTQELGVAPNRQYVIQWGCKRRNGPTDTINQFTAQIWLYEGPEPNNVFRVSYGGFFEDPANRPWLNVAWGFKTTLPWREVATEPAPVIAGVMGPSRNGVACTPTGGMLDRVDYPKCNAGDHFPAHSTVQYGYFDGADLTGAVAPKAMDVSPGRVSLETEVTLWNVGGEDVPNTKFDVYLSELQQIVVGSSISHKVSSRTTPVPVGKRGEVIVHDSFSSENRPKNGKYFVCIAIDPNQEVDEVDEGNNQICSSEQVSIGPDLIGSITAPPRASAFQAVDFPITIENVGNDEAGPFAYRVWMIPDEPEDGSVNVYNELLYEGRVEEGLGAGETFSLQVGLDPSAPVILPNAIRGEKYTFQLEIDPRREVAESDVSNNRVNSSNKMIHDMPELRLDTPIAVEMQWGCYFGQPVEATLQVCNHGTAPAWNFHPGLVFGDQLSPNLSNDATAAAYPAKCYAPQDDYGNYNPNHLACEPIEGKEVPCVDTYCRLPCEVDADCGWGPGLVCRMDEGRQTKSCMLQVDAPATPAEPECVTVRVEGRIPLVQAGTTNRYLVDGEWRFHYIHDLDNMISQPLPFIWSGPSMSCRESLPDLVPTSITAPQRIKAGEPTPVKRVIRNVGFTEFPRGAAPPAPPPEAPETIRVRYRYYLSTTQDISVNQLPVEVQSTGGAGEIAALGTIKGGGESALTELLVVPPQTAPGSYYLGLIVDPENEYRELDKTNNIYVFPTRIQVEAPSLSILTSNLPIAALGGSLVYEFVGVGGTGAYSWSAVNLPPGLSFSQQGVLSGTPTEAGVFAFTVRLNSGATSTERMVVLRVVVPQGSLEITTEVLPPAVPLRPYGGWTDGLGRDHDGVRLIASGGQPPYEWHFQESASNRMPQGISPPDSTGLIMGVPTMGAEAREFDVSVSDSLGNRASARLRIDVWKSNRSLTIISGRFAEGRAAQETPPYNSCIEASGGDSLADYKWEVDTSTIPPGLEPETQGKRLCLKGIPLVCGNYMVKVGVEDVQGQRFSAALLLSVECDSTAGIEPRLLDDVRRGEVVEIQLSSNTGPDAIYRLYQGALPEGLSLASDGLIAGTVAEDAASGTYAFVVEVSDSKGHQGLTALALTVRTEPKQAVVVVEESGGCGSTAAGASQGLTPAGLAVLGLALLNRRRRAREETASWLATSGLAGVLVLVAVGAAGCGSTTTTVQGLCYQVVCDPGLECDEESGDCQCGGTGGISCGPGEVCKLDPEPSCEASMCEFVTCERGESCEGATGMCSCGGVSCQEGEVCKDNICKVSDGCSDVSCSAGFSCDPADGKCKCFGQVCEDGELCLDGQCLFSLCAGVNCGLNNVCNPDDGVCHCMDPAGPICHAGQACDAETRACVTSDACASVSCGDGAVCDPADGRCHCGGVGSLTPICDPGQTCFRNKCFGGDLCAPGGVPNECGGSTTPLSCDPTDGLCKCGGQGGLVCAPGEQCAQLDGQWTCAQECTILGLSSMNCPPGESCYLDSIPGRRPYCAPTGIVQRGDTCTEPSDCAKDHYCGESGKCFLLCPLSEGRGGCAALGPSYECIRFSENAPQDVGLCASF